MRVVRAIRSWAAAAVAAVLLGGPGARADVVGLSRRCAPWERPAGVSPHRQVVSCEPSPCTSDSECGGGVCMRRRVCVLEVEVSRYPDGPCRDGDARCRRERVIEEREVGFCDLERRCIEGRCELRGSCGAPP